MAKAILLRPEDLNKIVSVNDAAILTGIHDQTLREWLRQGRLTRYGTRRCYRVLLSELLPVTPRKIAKAVVKNPIK